MSSTPAVTAVLVGYDGPPQMIVDAVASLRTQTLVPTQLVCVDQSADQRFAAALRSDPGVDVIVPEANLGYPAACNRAAAVATGEHILFLNPDAHAKPDCVAQLAAALAARPDAAIAGAQVLLPGEERVNAGDNTLHLSGLSWAGRYGLSPEHGPPRPSAVCSGAALLVRRAAFDALGGYTPGFFMYYDDVDLAWRARLLGWEVLFCPAADVVHDYEFTKGDYKWLWLERNRWWCLIAHLRPLTLVALTPLLAAVEMAVLAKARREGWLGAKLGAYRALWQSRAGLAARRREIQASRIIGDRPIVERMSASVESPFLDSAAVRRAQAPLRFYRRLVRALTH